MPLTLDQLIVIWISICLSKKAVPTTAAATTAAEMAGWKRKTSIDNSDGKQQKIVAEVEAKAKATVPSPAAAATAAKGVDTRKTKWTIERPYNPIRFEWIEEHQTRSKLSVS